MYQNIKKGHSSNCHNNCWIHHNPDFFNYYQYPAFPHYGCGVPPWGQYAMSQYQYSPIIQHPITGLQTQQGFMTGYPYQYIPNYGYGGQNLNSLPNNRINGNFYQPFGEDYYLSRYNSRSPLGRNRTIL